MRFRSWIGNQGERSPRRSFGRRRIALLCVVGLGVLGASGAGVVSAESSPQQPPALDQLTQKQTTVTLITGDKVVYKQLGDGRATATILPNASGTSPAFRSYQTPQGLYVIPDEVEQYVDDGELDRQLFNVKYLADNGYGDSASGSLPVIASFSSQVPQSEVPARVDQLDGVQPGKDLGSIHGASFVVAKKAARRFWSSVAPATSTTSSTQPVLGDGLKHLWLDEKMKVADDVSTPMIGAPTAWALGYDGTGVKVAILDTGIDLTHPDLQGKVVASQDFVPGDSGITDHFGHGTHVASIIAGTGAASDGKYKGIAPGAQLVIGKVLNDQGVGEESWILAGMQWAANSGAPVVSMSLGGAPTDGTDPLSQAVDDLTASTGTLFVIAAGNSGPSSGTIGSPGAADAALTVGAVNKSDQLATFSSRGPRFGDFALKPDITAPGVDIIAARAAGTSMGTPLDQYYTSASGTSMATPHVAGSVALLAEEHPDWKAQQFKAALMGTAKDDGYSVWEQGAGRVDVGRAVTQQVFDNTPSISTQTFWPYTNSGPTAHTITYTNYGKSDVTLSLSLPIQDGNGNPAPAGLGALGTSTLTVPAGGSASTQVTIDPTAVDPGTYSGNLVATDAGGDHLTIPIGVYKGPKLDKLTIRVIARPNTYTYFWEGPLSPGAALVARVDDSQPSDRGFDFTPLQQTSDPNVYEGSLYVVDGGSYSVTDMPLWTDARSRNDAAMLVAPQLKVTDNTTLTFDLTKAQPVRIDTPTPTRSTDSALEYTRIAQSETGYWTGAIGPWGQNAQLWVSPTSAKPTIGSGHLLIAEDLEAPQVTATLEGAQPVDLHATYEDKLAPWTSRFSTHQRLPVATENQLLNGVDVRGKLVFVNRDDANVDYRPITGDWEFDPIPIVDKAIAAGAAGVILHDARFSRGGWGLWEAPPTPQWPIPLLWIDAPAAAQLQAALSRPSEPIIDLQPQVVTPFEYHLRYYVPGQIPDQPLVYNVDPKKMVRRDTSYHAEFQPPPPTEGVSANGDMLETQNSFAPGDFLSILYGDSFNGPANRTEYWNVDPNITWEAAYDLSDWATGTIDSPNWLESFSTASTGQRTIGAPPVVPAQTEPNRNSLFPELCTFCRQGDVMYLELPSLIYGDDFGHRDALEFADTHLLQDGQEIPLTKGPLGLPAYSLPSDAGRYVLQMNTTDQSGIRRFANNVHTEWTFESSQPSSTNVGPELACIDQLFARDRSPCALQPLIFIGYKLDLALDDTAPAGQAHVITITPHDPDPDAPSISGIKVSVSFDGGTTWQRAPTSASTSSDYAVTIPAQPRAQTDGAVSLKVQAWDAGGDSVTQTIDDAYGLK